MVVESESFELPVDYCDSNLKASFIHENTTTGNYGEITEYV